MCWHIKPPCTGGEPHQFKILPFNFFETCHYFRNFSPSDCALIYGIAGGTPQYLLQMDDSMSVDENIKNTFLNSSSALFEEPENLLKQEVREPSLYNAIISAIASGASKLSEISTKVGENSSTCTAYLKNLISLGLVRRETPYGEKNSKKTIYTVEGNMFRFWYRFIPDNASLIVRGASDLAYQRIRPQISDYMGKIFEDICTQYLWQLLLNGKSPVFFKELGRWWELIQPHMRKQKSTSWESRTRIQPCFANANGQTISLIPVSSSFLSIEASFSTTTPHICFCFRKTVLQVDVRKWPKNSET